MNRVDTSDLEPFLIKENDLLLMGINKGQRYIPLRVMARIETPYLYDTVAEGALPSGVAASTSTNGVLNNTFVPALQLSSQNLPGKPYDVFDISKYPDLLYQMFYGIDPPGVRVFLQQPFKVDQYSLPTIAYTPAYAQEGYRDGFESPFYRPSHKTQVFVLPGLSIALGFVNVEPQVVYPQLLFWINALSVAVVTDPHLVLRMITEPGVAKIYTVAGLQSVSYSIPSYYKIQGVKLTDTTVEQVEAGLK